MDDQGQSRDRLASPPLTKQSNDAGDAPRLTSMEREVLRLINLGYPRKRIGTALKRRVSTVDYHIKNLHFKLDAANAVEVLRTARRLGLVDDEA